MSFGKADKRGYLGDLILFKEERREELLVEVKKYLAPRHFLKETFNKSRKVYEGCSSRRNFDFNSWSVISKIMKKKNITLEAQANEVSRVDSEFKSEKTVTTIDVQILESYIKVLEDGLESLSKSVIKILNI
ncbi:uncharacterized protein LOC111831550 [Capsella rubella]|uniref:uncharacterized protein LOC111831550 n=1 Tax=Capsella rubella TaxID=81985 RepID=UPI000CD4D8B5|nr:uncharacterized protein LOC111831550 [Capsella rubella]